MWRLVLDAGMDYNTVFHQMTLDEIEEANAALTYYSELLDKEAKKK